MCGTSYCIFFMKQKNMSSLYIFYFSLLTFMLNYTTLWNNAVNRKCSECYRTEKFCDCNQIS
jgi:hypothetical protein